MIEETNIAFNEYMESFKTLDVKTKRLEILEAIKEFGALITALAESENKSLSVLKNKEIVDLKNGEESEEDFLEALLVYIENSKNLLGQYLMEKIN